MYQIKMENCNNIIQGELTIENGKLNIFYGINGTGKTTIAKAIEFSKEPQKIKELQSFLKEDPASQSVRKLERYWYLMKISSGILFLKKMKLYKIHLKYF